MNLDIYRQKLRSRPHKYLKRILPCWVLKELLLFRAAKAVKLDDF
jgi:hypothetical protein